MDRGSDQGVGNSALRGEVSPQYLLLFLWREFGEGLGSRIGDRSAEAEDSLKGLVGIKKYTGLVLARLGIGHPSWRVGFLDAEFSPSGGHIGFRLRRNAGGACGNHPASQQEKKKLSRRENRNHVHTLIRGSRKVDPAETDYPKE